MQQLFQELTEQQFEQLVEYFRFKQTTGKLAAARQLLLQLISAVSIPAASKAIYKGQVQQYC